MTTINLSSLDGADGFQLNGVDIADGSGVAVADAGDVNGDGYDDIVVGAFKADPNGDSGAGSTYVVFGKPSGFQAEISLGDLDGADGFRLDGIDPEDRSGRAVSGAGDVNNDGFADIIVGARGAEPNDEFRAGESYVVFGRATGFAAAIDLGELDGADGFLVEGADQSDNSGISVSGAGDFNGDGFDDLIVGAYGADARSNLGAGETYLIFAQADGFPAVMNVAELDGSDGIRLNGIAEGDTSGISVDSAGDVNGDGLDDLIIGAFAADPDGKSGAGESYVVFGRDDELSASFTLFGLNGSNGFIIAGVDPLDTSGVSVADAGDVNADGFADVIVGALEADPHGASGAGESYVIFGKAEGFDAVIKPNRLDGSDGFRLNGRNPDDNSGYSVSGAGDVNGDGYDDVIVGAFKADPSNKSYAGESYVVFGGPNGTAGSIDLGELTNATGVRLNGAVANDRSGSSVSGAGDVDGDGFDDFLIGAFFAAGDTIAAGETYVVFGRDFTNAVTHAGTDADETLTGDMEANVIVGGRGDDLLEGGGGADTLRGGGGDDILAISDTGYRRIDGGGGTDALRLAAAGLALDFTATGSQLVADVEGVDLADPTARVTFDQRSVQHLSSASNRVSVTGVDGADLAVSDGKWRLTGSDGAHETYRKGGAELVVAADIDVDISRLLSISLEALHGDDGFRLDGVAAGDAAGAAVAGAGDVNGDGYADVIVGAPGADPGGMIDAGESYVVFGGAAGLAAIVDPAGLDGSQGFRLAGAAAGDGAGGAVAGAGDVNGDGYGDLIVGAGAADGGAAGSGAAYLVFGQAAGFAAEVDLAALDGVDGFRIDGIDTGDGAGVSVAGAGDINGDGYHDMLIGAPTADLAGGGDHGETYVVFGSRFGFGAAIDLSGLDGGDGFRLVGVDPDDRSGFAVAGAGDVNRDGYFDLIVGAPAADPNGRADAGASYVLFGQAGGFAATVDLSALDGSDGFRLDGATAGDRSGVSVAGAGDVNGDGYGDLIVGADMASSYLRPGAGASFVVFGKAGGFAAAVDLGALDGVDGFRLDGVAAHEQSGGAVAGAGDVNGDGLGDLIVGAAMSDIDEIGDVGETYIVFGQRAGFAPALDLATLDGTIGTRLLGLDGMDRAGGAVAAAGDVNGDGYHDLIVGAAGADTAGGAEAGESYIFFGRDLSGAQTHPGTEGDDVVNGDGLANVAALGLGDDIFSAGSGDDAVQGGAGRDRVSMGAGDDLAFGGAGDDVLNGSLGDDILYGGDGVDRLTLGSGADVAYGGAGTDLFYARATELGAGDSLFGGPGLLDSLVVQSRGVLDLTALDAFVGIERVRIAADQTIISTDDDIFFFGRGGDEIYGMGDGDDLVKAGNGVDILDGAGGDDILIGHEGDDTIQGGPGRDKVTGSGGNDVFVFAPGFEIDAVRDFTKGEDLLDVTAFGFADYATEIAPLITNINNKAVVSLAPGDRAILIGVLAEDLDVDDFLV